MKPPSLEYIAAFFDGEGCVSSHTNWHGWTTVNLKMSQTHDSQVLFDIQSVIGGRVRYTNRGYYLWVITGAPAVRKVIRLIYPYSRVKRDQLRLAYEFCGLVSKRGGTPTLEACARRLEIHHQLKALKREGGNRSGETS